MKTQINDIEVFDEEVVTVTPNDCYILSESSFKEEWINDDYWEIYK